MRYKLVWNSLKREELPGVVAYPQGNKARASSLSALTLQDEGIAVAYDRDRKEIRSAPLVCNFHDDMYPDLFAWIKTFSPEIFPVSQFTKVYTHSDWLFFVESQLELQNIHNGSLWSCLVLGEMLAQSDDKFSVENIPISSAFGTFTAAYARASMHCSSLSLHNIVLSRLRFVERDNRFSNRAVDVAKLMPVWKCVDSIDNVESRLFLIIRNIIRTMHDSGVFLDLDSDDVFFDLLNTKSIERRVLSFNEIIRDVELGKYTNEMTVSFILGVSSFLVGGGTSHLFLLKMFRKTYPLSYVWFSLMAGILGVDCWDGKWFGTTRRIERLLRSEFSLTDIPNVDLSWPEFEWYSRSFSELVAFDDIHKIQPRVLSIEVFPSIVIHLKLNSNENKKSENEKEDINEDNLHMINALSMIVEASLYVQELLGAKNSKAYVRDVRDSREQVNSAKRARKPNPK